MYAARITSSRQPHRYDRKLAASQQSKELWRTLSVHEDLKVPAPLVKSGETGSAGGAAASSGTLRQRLRRRARCSYRKIPLEVGNIFGKLKVAKRMTFKLWTKQDDKCSLMPVVACFRPFYITESFSQQPTPCERCVAKPHKT